MQVDQMQRLRQFVERTMCRLGAERPAVVQESILIENGYYCGRRFRCDGFEAVWFAEENQLKFYSPEGNIVETSSLAEPAARSVEARAA